MEPVHWMKIAFDLIASCLGLALYQYLALFAVPFKSSFYCADYYTINLPFKKSTVTNGHLYMICLALPFVIFLMTEVMRLLYFRFESSTSNIVIKKNKSHKQQQKHLIHSSSTTSNSSSNSSAPSPRHQRDAADSNNKRQRYFYKLKLTNEKQMSLPEELGNMYINCGSFFVGILATAVLTDFIKVVVGRLRPNFLDVCRPDRSISELCSPNNHLNKTHLVPEVDFKCLNYDRPQIEESRKSFPSGHASLSFYSMVFLILFIHHSWKSKRMGLLPRFIQFFLFMLALYSTLTRSIDNKHHVGDMIAGICLGTLIGCLTFFFLTDFLKKDALKKRFRNSEYQKCNDYLDNESNSGVSTNSSRSSNGCLVFSSNSIENNTNPSNLNEIERKRPLITHLDNENVIVLNELVNTPFTNNDNSSKENNSFNRKN